MQNSVPFVLTGESVPLVGETTRSGSEPGVRWAVNGAGCLCEENNDTRSIIMDSYLLVATRQPEPNT